MMRQEYIAGLEEIRKQTIKIGQAFAAVDLTDATGMERDRRKKTAKLVGDLADRLYEDIAISAKVAADKAEAGQGEQDDLFAAADRESKGAKPKAADATEAEVVDAPRSWTRRGSRTSRWPFRPRSRRRRAARAKARSPARKAVRNDGHH